MSSKKLRILVATEYLPPYVSGIANRCKNLINGFRSEGHEVTVCSVAGTDCDIVVPSVPNPFYLAQRTFILPPWKLVKQLLDFSQPLPYDIVHAVAPLCLSFLWILPFLWLRGVKVYVSYHVFLEFYCNMYVIDNSQILPIMRVIFGIIYYIPLTIWADCVGIPSKTADGYVFHYSRRIHYLKSGLDTEVFVPQRVDDDAVSTKSTDSTLSTPSQNLDSSQDSTASDTDTSSSTVRLIQSVEKKSDNAIKDLRQIAFPNEESLEKAGPLLIYVGRLAMEKNIEFLIDSLSHPSLTEASLVIVGDGPCRESLEKRAEETVGAEHVFSVKHTADGDVVPFKNPTISQRVIFTGMILNERQVAAYYGQCDIFVSASASETFGFTVAEAMSTGTPAVVVRSGAFKTVYKMIDDWMFEDGNHEEFAACISHVMKRGVTVRRFARDVAVQGFSIRSAVLDLLATYEWIVDGCPSSQSKADNHNSTLYTPPTSGLANKAL